MQVNIFMALGFSTFSLDNPFCPPVGQRVDSNAQFLKQSLQVSASNLHQLKMGWTYLRFLNFDGPNT